MSDHLTWEQKFAALKAIGDASLRMRAPGDWYVDLRGVEVSRGLMLESPVQSEPDPESAVAVAWEQHTDISEDQQLCIRGGRRVRWSGFMWADCDV